MKQYPGDSDTVPRCPRCGGVVFEQPIATQVCCSSVYGKIDVCINCGPLLGSVR